MASRKQLPRSVALLCVTCLASVAGQPPPPSPSPPPALPPLPPPLGTNPTGVNVTAVNGTITLNVCTSPNPPLSSCAEDGQAPVGLEIDVFREVVARLNGYAGNNVSVNVTWVCLGLAEIADHLEAADGVCDVAVAGMSVTPELVKRGIVPTWPTFHNGLRILTRPSIQEPSIWDFWSAFSWEVWVALFAACFIAAAAMFAFERIAHHRQSISPDPTQYSLTQRCFQTLGQPIGNQLATATLASSIVGLALAFIGYILFVLFQANVTANLTAQVLQTPISTVADLPGKAVGTWTAYQTKLAKYGVDAVGYPWEKNATGDQLLRLVASGELDAFVLDATVLSYLSSTDCELLVVGPQFELFDQAIALPKGSDRNQGLLSSINDAIVDLWFYGYIEGLIHQYVDVPLPECKNRVQTNQGNQVTFHQVAGLWIIFGAAVGLAALLVALDAATARRRQRLLAAASTRMRRLSRSLSMRGGRRRRGGGAIDIAGLPFHDGAGGAKSEGVHGARGGGGGTENGGGGKEEEGDGAERGGGGVVISRQLYESLVEAADTLGPALADFAASQPRRRRPPH